MSANVKARSDHLRTSPISSAIAHAEFADHRIAAGLNATAPTLPGTFDSTGAADRA
jgi:hypothetical protein